MDTTSGGTLAGIATGLLIVVILVALGILVLNLVATYKIITKAGYSGRWMIVPLLPLIIYVLIVLDVISTPAFTVSQYSTGSFLLLGVFDGLSAVLSWVFFLVFAFSDWPVRRQLRQAQQTSTRTAWSSYQQQPWSNPGQR